MTNSHNPGDGGLYVPGRTEAGAGPQIATGQGIIGQSSPYIANANTTVVGSSIVYHLPDEKVAVLRKMEFQLLADGDTAGARAGRDLFLGFLFSGVIGLIGLLATTAWVDVFTKGNWGPAVWTGLMFAIVAASAVGASIFEVRRRKLSKDSAYSSLIIRLQSDFDINPDLPRSD